MAKKVGSRESAPETRRPPAAAVPDARLEECRARLESVELLLSSSPRDALVLARALLDDVVGVVAALYLPEEARAAASPETVMRALPRTTTRESLAAARRWLESAEASGSVSAEGVTALRRVVADLARVAGDADVTGLLTLRRLLGSTAWRRAGVVAAVAAVILVAALQMRSGLGGSSAQFDALFSEASQRLTAGDYAQAAERFRSAIAAMPGKDRTADAWNDLGWSLFKLGRYREAVEAYSEALLLRPAFPLARNNMAVAQQKLKESGTEPQQPPAQK
jgi:tetratricopeptide (TPR) repeat protein